MLSTFWRDFLDYVTFVFSRMDLPAPIGRTAGSPHLAEYKARKVARAVEIQDYLQAHPQITRFVILDDMPLGPDELMATEPYASLVPHIVRTNGTTGLTDDDVARAVEVLKIEDEPVPPPPPPVFEKTASEAAAAAAAEQAEIEAAKVAKAARIKARAEAEVREAAAAAEAAKIEAEAARVKAEREAKREASRALQKRQWAAFEAKKAEVATNLAEAEAEAAAAAAMFMEAEAQAEREAQAE